MNKKVLKACNYLFYIMISNTIFGIIYYFTFTSLANFSVLWAYFGSLILIIIGLLLDRNTKSIFISQKLYDDLNKLDKKHRALNYKIIYWIMESFISFKTVLFIFYFIILVISQIINIDNTIFNKDISNFVLANSYSIVLLIALDRIITQFSKDRIEMEKISNEFAQNLRRNF